MFFFPCSEGSRINLKRQSFVLMTENLALHNPALFHITQMTVNLDLKLCTFHLMKSFPIQMTKALLSVSVVRIKPPGLVLNVGVPILCQTFLEKMVNEEAVSFCI